MYLRIPKYIQAAPFDALERKGVAQVSSEYKEEGRSDGITLLPRIGWVLSLLRWGLLGRNLYEALTITATLAALSS